MKINFLINVELEVLEDFVQSVTVTHGIQDQDQEQEHHVSTQDLEICVESVQKSTRHQSILQSY